MTDSSEAVPALAAILTERGALAVEDIELRLREAGVTDPDAVIEELLDEYSCPARPLPDDRWVWLPALLAGRVFTHRLTAEELGHDVLAVSPDLDPISELCNDDDYAELADGSPLAVVLPGYDDELLEERGIPLELIAESGALLLKPGTLAGLGLAAGDLLGLRLTAGGIALEPVTATTDTTLGDRLAALLDADEPSYFAAVVWAVCTADPALFTTPLAPLGEVADEHGLAHSGDWLAPTGFDFERWRFERKCARLADRYGLDDDDAFALTTLVEIHAQLAQVLDIAMDHPNDEAAVEAPAETEPVDGQYADVLGELGAALANPVLALSFMEEATREGRAGAAALGMFAESLESKVPRSARVATRWLQGMACEGLGDVAGCERELLAAESLDPDWPLPLLTLARIASDRGDAEAGLGLLHRAGVGSDYPLVRLLEQHRVQPRTDVGRNEPCWCGSGRKYKKCHLGREQLSLPERVGWLYAKAHQQLLGGEWAELLMLAGYERIRHVEDEIDDLVAAAKTDPLAIDTMLFEGGAFAEFLELRGALLPDDERQLAGQWLEVPRAVFEVEQVRPGHSVTVRDVRTGEVFEVTTRSRALEPGQLICSRALPTGEGFAFFGGIDPVEPAERDELLALLDTDPDPVELVEFLSRRFAVSDVFDESEEPAGTDWSG
ncbi:YecA family protein [Mycolicibacter senuensis]|uniref:YecA family protein n=1 Tax=Mycolicibacter senuensis TaxID=386913 RepID=UPI0025713054|nr:SEC-C metal-binding domain-containing protein [Mycolicibacter senuensis]